MRRWLLTILLALAAATPIFSQGILIPEIINYSKKAYESGNQNRYIDQDQRGLMYFANEDGLLVFDGTYWKTYPLPNGSIVRSLAVQGDRIYVGGQQEIGYFFFDKKGALSYQSLKSLIPPGETEFSDVWHLMCYRGDVFFRSNKRIFQYRPEGKDAGGGEGKITAYKSINWGFLGVNKDLLIAQQYENGLVVFKEGRWVPLRSRYEFANDKMGVRSVTALGANKTLVTTLRSGVYVIDGGATNEGAITKFESPSMAAISADLIQYSGAIDTTRIVIGTRLGGYYVVNTKGEMLQHVTKQEGLQSNTVNTVFVDNDKNIWLGLNNGIDLVIYNSAINHINPNHDNKSPGYSAALYNDKLFIGTGMGLFSIPVAGAGQTSFSPVKNGNGLVWGLSVVNGQLLVGRSDGAYVVSDGVCNPIDTSTGFWFFQPLSAGQPCPRVIAGTYNGVNVYNYENGKFVNPRYHSFFESAKYTVVAGNEIWVAHPYQGLYKISFNDTGAPVNRPYRDVRGILSSGHNYLFKIQDKIVLVTRRGVYAYDRALGDFVVSTFFQKIFGASYISYLREDTQGNIWFVEEKKPGVIDMSSPENPVKVYFPELNNRILGNDEEFIYPINKNNILFSSEAGFYHLDYEKYKETGRRLRVLLRSVTAIYQRDSVLFGGYRLGRDSIEPGDIYTFSPTIRYKWNSLHFEFSSPYFGGLVEYSCRLTGYEKGWSAWSKKTERTYTNLPAGTYVFEVSARNNIGGQSSLSQFYFTISPPWYKTYIAYFFYLLIIVAVMYFFYWRQQRKYILQHNERLRKQREKFDEEQKRLQYQHQLEIEKNEKEIIRLKNIKLESEVQHNEAELASNTMNLLQKRELLNKIKDEILAVQDEQEDERRLKNIRRIIKIINEELDVSDDWEKFSVYFDKTNNDFLRTLKDNYPLLTPTDLKLCAYLRLNLSTKAIAELLNLSIRGVESSRYRLRKKLDLAGEVSLSDFLGGIGNDTQH